MSEIIPTMYLAIALASNLYAEAGVRFKKDTIEIELENNGKVILANNLKMNTDGWYRYWYRGYWQSIGYHKIASDGYEEHGSFELINGKTGKKTEFSESEPILNEIGWAI